MQIVIDISDEQYEIIKKLVKNQNSVCPDAESAEKIILKGTPLPKGHGRLIDEKDILDTENNDGGWYDLVDMPEYIAGVKAIIEADRAESEDKE